MSGPKGIEYEIARERRALETARAQWRGVVGRRRRLLDRARIHGVELESIPHSQNPGSTASEVLRACDELLRRVERLERSLALTLEEQSHSAATLNLGSVINRLRAADAQRSAGYEAADDRPETTVNGHREFDVERHRTAVEQRLTSLPPGLHFDVQAKFDNALSASTSHDARLTLRELDSAIAAAMRAREARVSQDAALGAARAKLDALIEPGDLRRRLDELQAAADARRDIRSESNELIRAADRAFADEAGERDRRCVAESVRQSLQELGYRVSDIELYTPSTIVMEAPGSPLHAVAITVSDAEVDIRSVATAESTALQDKDADVALCTALPDIVESMNSVGIEVSRVRSTPSGLVRAQQVSTRGRDAGSTSGGSSSRRRERKEQHRSGGSR